MRSRENEGMRRDATRATVVLFMAVGLGAWRVVAAAAQAPPPQPSFPAQAEIVTVDVVVTGRGSEAVLDLRREDFSVTEDGVRAGGRGLRGGAPSRARQRERRGARVGGPGRRAAQLLEP